MKVHRIKQTTTNMSENSTENLTEKLLKNVEEVSAFEGKFNVLQAEMAKVRAENAVLMAEKAEVKMKYIETKKALTHAIIKLKKLEAANKTEIPTVAPAAETVQAEAASTNVLIATVEEKSSAEAQMQSIETAVVAPKPTGEEKAAAAAAASKPASEEKAAAAAATPKPAGKEKAAAAAAASKPAWCGENPLLKKAPAEQEQIESDHKLAQRVDAIENGKEAPEGEFEPVQHGKKRNDRKPRNAFCVASCVTNTVEDLSKDYNLRYPDTRVKVRMSKTDYQDCLRRIKKLNGLARRVDAIFEKQYQYNKEGTNFFLNGGEVSLNTAIQTVFGTDDGTTMIDIRTITETHFDEQGEYKAKVDKFFFSEECLRRFDAISQLTREEMEEGSEGYTLKRHSLLLGQFIAEVINPEMKPEADDASTA